MNTTRTTTITLPAAETLTLHLRQTVPQRVQNIVRRLLNRTDLTHQERATIEEWNRNAENGVWGLCDLLCAGLYPLIRRTEDISLLDIEDSLREMIREALPPGDDLDKFIESYEESIAQLEQSKTRVQRVTEAMQRELQRLSEAYERTDLNLVAQFERLRLRLIQFNEGREETVVRLEGLLINLTNTFNHAVDSTLERTERTEELGQRAEEQQQQLNKLVEECHAALNNC